MSEFEQVEDYLTNRLDDGARIAFEQRMENDAQLKEEVNLQAEIIEGVKTARAAELKAMLNSVPVGGASSATTGKIVLATLSAGILGTLLYFGLRSPTEEMPQPVEISAIEEQAQYEQSAEGPEVIDDNAKPIIGSKKENKAKPVQGKKEETTGVKRLKSAEVVSPKVHVLDLTEETKSHAEEATPPPAPASKPTVSTSSIEVELDNTDKTYSFHYQFKNDKLLLYGPFDKSLYEVIEINGDIHTLFLYYKNSYYHLDESISGIEPLIMIRDKELLNKLEKYRNAN